jgi:hypothetical protein
MRLYAAGDDLERTRQPELAGAISEQLSVAHHGLEPVLERAQMLLAADGKQPAERLERERARRPIESRKDLLAGGNLMFVWLQEITAASV